MVWHYWKSFGRKRDLCFCSWSWSVSRLYKEEISLKLVNTKRKLSSKDSVYHSCSNFHHCKEVSSSWDFAAHIFVAFYQFFNDLLTLCIICIKVGHGKSEGTQAIISDYNIFVHDILQHVSIVTQEYPDIPVFLLGHSMVRVL